MTNQISSNEQIAQRTPFEIFSNKKSKMNESILVQHSPERGSYSLHVYAVILPQGQYFYQNKRIIDLRKKSTKKFNPFKVIGEQKRGSLSFTRILVKNPAEEKYEKKLREKYPEKKTIKKRRTFPPLLLQIAHFCDQFNYPEGVTSEEISEEIKKTLSEFDDFIQDDLHQTLRVLGKVLYLKGERCLIRFHQSREFPEKILEKLLEEKMIEPATKLQSFMKLSPVIEGMRRDNREQLLLPKKKADPRAITHIFTEKNNLVPILEEQFPVIVVGEPDIRRNIILNLLKNANARFLILDPKDQYGKIAMANPRVRGYILGENYYLNIISTEAERIREQIYAYWFSKIIAHSCGLREDIAKTLETYLLGVYNDSSNYDGTEIQFRAFANYELTSEVAKMTRNESTRIANILYPLGTYDEIAVTTIIGRSLLFESLLETKGSVIQFPKDDEQLTKIAYLFTLLKLRSVQSRDYTILVLENLDDFIDDALQGGKTNDLRNLILSLPRNFFIIIGARAPSKIKELFKNSNTKVINRLSVAPDLWLFEKEFNISRQDIKRLSKLTEREFFLLFPELSQPRIFKVGLEPDTKMRIKVDPSEKASSVRILNAQHYRRKDGIPPEIKKAIFELIKILREKPKKRMPEEGIEKVMLNCAEEDALDALRAKEIAITEAFIKKVEASPKDSTETIGLIKLTERGEAFYQEYLNLQKEIRKISITSLDTEKEFEKEILSLLAKANLLMKEEEYALAVDHMIKIVVRLLGALPEQERFIDKKYASELMEQWTYLSSLKETGTQNKAKRFYDNFAQLVTNTLKELKHKVVDGGEAYKETQPQSPMPPLQRQFVEATEEEHDSKKALVDEDEFEYEIPNEPKVYLREKHPWEQQVELLREPRSKGEGKRIKRRKQAKKGIIVDGNNVAYDQKHLRNGKADPQRLAIVRKELENYFPPEFIIINVSPSLKYHTVDSNSKKNIPSKSLEELITRGIVKETPSERLDDNFIIKEAQKADFFILTNDRFNEWRKKDRKQHKDLTERRVGFTWIDNLQMFNFDDKLLPPMIIIEDVENEELEEKKVLEGRTEVESSFDEAREMDEDYPEADIDSDKNNSSLFHAATKDLQAAGMSYLDSEGKRINPKKKKRKEIQQGTNKGNKGLIKEEREEELFDPFESLEGKETQTNRNPKNIQQKKEVERIKKKLINKVIKRLPVKNLTAEDKQFIWNYLNSRFPGKINDDYAISELVSTLSRLIADVENEAVISERIIARLQRLIESSKLMPDELVSDIKQYFID